MIIQYVNGALIDVADYQLTRLFHYIPSPEIEHAHASVEGIGDIITQTRIKNRIISVEFMVKSYDTFDYYLLRDEINALFTREDSFYIIFKREPYKRYKVRLANQFEVPPQKHLGKFTIEFIMVQRFAESVASTADVKEWDADKWAWNGVISWDDDVHYEFTNNRFIVKNLGNVIVDPREYELEIALTGSFPHFVRITNETTSDVYQYNRSLSSTDELRLARIRTLRNGISDFKHTNKQLLTLAVGDNNIKVEGGTVTSITFYFRYLFK